MGETQKGVNAQVVRDEAAVSRMPTWLMPETPRCVCGSWFKVQRIGESVCLG